MRASISYFVFFVSLHRAKTKKDNRSITATCDGILPRK
jgi:hypothetical protein